MRIPHQSEHTMRHCEHSEAIHSSTHADDGLLHCVRNDGAPQVVSAISRTQAICQAWREQGLTIGFVPTMGCLHEGHLSLVKAAREQCDRVVVSIFVNPLQFGKNEDFGTYPRPFERDLKKCAEAGVDLVFHPKMSDFYSRTFATRVLSGPLGKLYCGKSRPGFFDGVLTVVNILFNITSPNRAYFGEKDFQQLFLIKQLVRDLRLKVAIVGMPIVREASGLAMSSRNEYLSAQQREEALCLFAAIKATRKAFSGNERKSQALLKTAEAALLKNKAFEIDYLQIVDERSLIAVTNEVMRPARLLIAGHVGQSPRIRLIDNASVL